MKRVVLFVSSLPQRVTYCYGFPLLVWGLGFAEDLHFREHGTLAAVLKGKVRKWWKWSTTVGWGQVFHLDHLASLITRAHERVHQRQFEDDCFRGLLLGAMVWGVSGSPLAGFLVWYLSPVFLLTNFVTAWLRGARLFPLRDVMPYLQAEHERSARAQTDGRDGTPWAVREAKRLGDDVP